MNRYRRRAAIIAAALVLLTAGGCGPRAGEETPEAAATPTVATARQGRCGDGVCDEVEQSDPSLCPQDCEPTQELPPETPLPSSPTPMAATATSKPEVPGPGDKCGDGICDEAEQKNPGLCPQDCAETAVTVEVTPPEATPVPQPTSTEAAAGRETMTSPAGETAFVGDPTTVSQEGGGAVGPRQANLALILDASGSMNEALPGAGKTKLAVAKEVMAELIPLIPGEMNGSLWIYGHRHSGDPKSESCQDIEQVYGLGPVDSAAYVGQVQGISAKGYTPIADSIQQAAEALPPADFNSIILVSDGEETCGGDPCALAEALKASDSEVTIHVVGYAVNQATKEQLQCVAQASGGSYHDATDAAGLLQALEEALAATEVETILRVEVVGPAGAEVGAIVRLYDAGTDRLVSDYSAWKDNVVPPGSYDLLVETLPHVFYPGLALPEGSTTIVRIQLSAIHVLTPDGKEDTMTYVFDTAGNQLHFEYAGTIFLVPATYQLGVRNSMSRPIALSAGQTVEVRLGAIHVLTPDGKEDTMVYIYDTAGEQLDFGYAGTILLVPGSYQLGVNDTLSQPIPLGAGETVEFRLGAIRAAGSFELYDGAGNRLGLSRRDSALVVPGTYTVKLADGSSIENVIVEAGKVTEVR